MLKRVARAGRVAACPIIQGLAQFGRVSALEAESRRFKSYIPDQF